MEEGGGGGRESGGVSSPEELMGPVDSGFREEGTVCVCVCVCVCVISQLSLYHPFQPSVCI